MYRYSCYVFDDYCLLYIGNDKMRTRTLKRDVQKQTKKQADKFVKAIIKDFADNKKGLMEMFGLVTTQALNIKEFEETQDFGVVGKQYKTVYTKLKNDLGRLYEEIKNRAEIGNLALIKYHVADMTRAKLLNKFDEFKAIEKEHIKNTRKNLPTAEDMGIPQSWIDFFTTVEITAECIKDFIDYDTFTVKEKHYMRRFVTYATKYIKIIESEI